MTSSAEGVVTAPAAIEPLPPALSSMWRLCKLGYRHEPALMAVAFALALLSALPDALLALWLALLGEGLIASRPDLIRIAVLGLGLSATVTWFLRTVSTRVQRRFRDKVTIALESHVAGLQASIATIAHQERPEYLDRLSVRGIHLQHVSFTYPGTSRVVLDDVTVTLPAGAVVAIVGENGAGKTTLVKLLTKMYPPSSGDILVDDTPLANISPDAWRRRLAGAFQDFFRFELLARQTVGVGDVPHLDDAPAVRAAVARAGADDVVARFPRGLDTQLGPTWPEGVEVSFGQWQKLALARGFMRAEPLLLVLDEPTAALDAETEHALFERYAAAARTGTPANGRITVLVSHRFSTVRMADLIVVLDGATLVEVGTHEELMRTGGQYAELYRIQAASYK